VPRYPRYVIVKKARPRRGPRWLGLAKWTAVVLVVVAALTAGAALAWLQRTTAQVASNNPREVTQARPQLTHARPGRPVNILIIGSDRRASDPGIGARSDTMIVVRLDPRTGSIAMLSVPRDLRVRLPGYGTNKVNAAYAFGGAKLTLQVLKRLLGIPINDFVDANFNGFVQVVDQLGGAYLMIDHRYYNNTAVTDYASVDLEPGYQRLTGRQALSWVRFRHDQNGDFTRIARQQTFLREMKREVISSARLSSLPRFLSLMDLVSRNVTSDVSSLGKAYRLFRLAMRLDTSRIYQTHVEGSTQMIGGVSYVIATPAQVRAAVHRFLHPRWVPRRASTVGTTGGSPASAGSAGSPPASRSARAAVITDSAHHVAEWQALQRRCSLRLFMPAHLPSGLNYAQFRSYTVMAPRGPAKAAVVVGTAPQGGSWDLQAIAWTRPPILAGPAVTTVAGGRICSLYYDGPALRLIAWRVGAVAYWIENTVDEELSNREMLALAASSVPVP